MKTPTDLAFHTAPRNDVPEIVRMLVDHACGCDTTHEGMRLHAFRPGG